MSEFTPSIPSLQEPDEAAITSHWESLTRASQGSEELVLLQDDSGWPVRDPIQEDRFACPYWKNDDLPSSVRSRKCSDFGALEIHRLLADHLPQHVKTGELTQEKLDEVKSLRVGQLEKTTRQRAEERWQAVYKSLFPNTTSPVPSPYKTLSQSITAMTTTKDLTDPFPESDAGISDSLLDDPPREAPPGARYTYTPDNKFQCKLCFKVIKLKPDMSRHLRHKHDHARAVDCPYCGKSFARRDNLPRHVEIYHRIRHASDTADKTGQSTGHPSEA